MKSRFAPVAGTAASDYASFFTFAVGVTDLTAVHSFRPLA